MSAFYLDWRAAQVRKGTLDAIAHNLTRRDCRVNESALGRFLRLVVGIAR